MHSLLSRRCLLRAQGSQSVLLMARNIAQTRHFAWEAAHDDDDAALRDRLQKIRELAKARYEKKQSFEKKPRSNPAGREPVSRAPVDGKSYADWGKNKFKLPLRDKSGLLLGKQENPQRSRAKTKSGTSPEKKPAGEKRERSSQRPVKKKGEAVTLKAGKLEEEDDEDDSDDEEVLKSYVDKVRLEEDLKELEFSSGDEEGDEERVVKLGDGDDEKVDQPPSSDDLHQFAVKLLKSLDEEKDDSEKLLAELDSKLPQEVKVEGWSASLRERVERALVEKNLVPEKANEVKQEVQSSSSGKNEVKVEEVPQWVRELEELSGGEDDEAEEISEANQADEQEVEDEENVVEKFNSEASAAATVKLTGRAQAQALIEAADDRSGEIGALLQCEQKSLRVGIIGAPNAGKSCLLNYMVGTKVSAVSRKTNTTRNEILGVLTEKETQILFYDTPGLMLGYKGQSVRRDIKSRVQSAWMVTGHCEVLIALVDAHRQIERPDLRVRKLVEKLGKIPDPNPNNKRILCLNKVDLIKQKRELVPLAQELGGLPGFDRVFMISGLRGGGVRHLKEYLLEKAVLRPWEEQKGVITDMSPVMAAKEAVWEHVLDNIHQEIPYHLHHKHISWKVLKDRSIRIEQQLIVATENQKKILVGKGGNVIRKIGMAANEELTARFGTKVHLILDVKVSTNEHLYAAVENVPDEMFL